MTLHVALSGRVGRHLDLAVAFEAPARAVTALLGPSGSGKTTVLRAIAGLERFAGTVRLGDECWQTDGVFVPPHQRQVGYVFQGGSLLPHLTVAQNLAYAMRRAPVGPFIRDDVIAWTGIGGLLDRKPMRLSGGETQRVSIARALLSQPRLLLMDEPLSALDSEAKAQFLALFERLQRDLAIPVLYVTHDEGEAHRLAAQVIRMHQGGVASREFTV